MTRRRLRVGLGRRFALSASIWLTFAVPALAAVERCSKPLSDRIPERGSEAASGSDVMREVRDASGGFRDAVLARHLLSGNLPSYLRRLKPISVAGRLSDGKAIVITLCAMPGYLAVGDDGDFVRVPMGLAAAARVAHFYGFLLPTTKMVDAIHEQAEIRLSPRPMKPTREMSSTAYFLRHSRTVDDQRTEKGGSPSALTAGQKKDVVLSTRLRRKPGRVAIYGWHRTNGAPIQPLSTVHGAAYSDYSHGVRLISQTAFLNGEPFALADILRDRELAALLTSDGPMEDVRAFQASLFE